MSYSQKIYRLKQKVNKQTLEKLSSITPSSSKITHEEVLTKVAYGHTLPSAANAFGIAHAVADTFSLNGELVPVKLSPNERRPDFFSKNKAFEYEGASQVALAIADIKAAYKSWVMDKVMNSDSKKYANILSDVYHIYSLGNQHLTTKDFQTMLDNDIPIYIPYVYGTDPTLHAISLVIDREVLYVCNRGRNIPSNQEAGCVPYKMNKPATAETILELFENIKTHKSTKEDHVSQNLQDYFGVTWDRGQWKDLFKKEYPEKLKQTIFDEPQESGNCAFAGNEAAIQVLMHLLFVKHGIEPPNDVHLTASLYKEFVEYHQNLSIVNVLNASKDLKKIGLLEPLLDTLSTKIEYDHHQDRNECVSYLIDNTGLGYHNAERSACGKLTKNRIDLGKQYLLNTISDSEFYDLTTQQDLNPYAPYDYFRHTQRHQYNTKAHRSHTSQDMPVEKTLFASNDARSIAIYKLMAQSLSINHPKSYVGNTPYSEKFKQSQGSLPESDHYLNSLFEMGQMVSMKTPIQLGTRTLSKEEKSLPFVTNYLSGRSELSFNNHIHPPKETNAMMRTTFKTWLHQGVHNNDKFSEYKDALLATYNIYSINENHYSHDAPYCKLSNAESEIYLLPFSSQILQNDIPVFITLSYTSNKDKSARQVSIVIDDGTLYLNDHTIANGHPSKWVPYTLPDPEIMTPDFVHQLKNFVHLLQINAIPFYNDNGNMSLSGNRILRKNSPPHDFVSDIDDILKLFGIKQASWNSTQKPNTLYHNQETLMKFLTERMAMKFSDKSESRIKKEVDEMYKDFHEYTLNKQTVQLSHLKDKATKTERAAIDQFITELQKTDPSNDSYLRQECYYETKHEESYSERTHCHKLERIIQYNDKLSDMALNQELLGNNLIYQSTKTYETLPDWFDFSDSTGMNKYGYQQDSRGYMDNNHCMPEHKLFVPKCKEYQDQVSAHIKQFAIFHDDHNDPTHYTHLKDWNEFTHTMSASKQYNRYGYRQETLDNGKTVFLNKSFKTPEDMLIYRETDPLLSPKNKILQDYMLTRTLPAHLSSEDAYSQPHTNKDNANMNDTPYTEFPGWHEFDHLKGETWYNNYGYSKDHRSGDYKDVNGCSPEEKISSKNELCSEHADLISMYIQGTTQDRSIISKFFQAQTSEHADRFYQKLPNWYDNADTLNEYGYHKDIDGFFVDEHDCTPEEKCSNHITFNPHCAPYQDVISSCLETELDFF